MPPLSPKIYEKLLAAQSSLNSLEGIDATLKTILDEAAKLGHAESGSVFLYNPQENHLVFHLLTGANSQKLKGRTIQMGEGFVGYVAQARKIEQVSDAYRDPRFNNRFDTILNHRTHNLLAAPILYGDTLLGVLELVNHRNGPAFPTEIFKAIERFCERAADVLGTLLKLQEAEAAAEKWKTLFSLNAHADVAENPLDQMIGESLAVQRVKNEIRQVSVTPSTVLIRGETGTGKELVARAIHDLSPRCKQPFVRVNCGAIPANLIESELFGHEKGSFTGAFQRKLGRFELANHGTLFLDEIGDLPMEMQVKLLRVLQQQEFERVGGSETLKVDVRIIAATHVNLEKAIRENRMRADLYYRLNIFPIHLPPLRERKEDIPALAHAFLEKYNRRLHHSVKGFSEHVYQKLLDYDWPGNIRELESMIERATVVCPGDIIDSILLSDDPLAGAPTTRPAQPFQLPSIPEAFPLSLTAGVEEYKRCLIEKALVAASGNQRAAATKLGLAPSNLSRMMKQLGISTKGAPSRLTLSFISRQKTNRLPPYSTKQPS